mmetsp:Transcript_43035/g.108695  ORF Transcript_43035/g.108695 Transcript_43035/m.108695 type:complete len:103 (+) Transcript_43035:29-337(+)
MWKPSTERSKHPAVLLVLYPPSPLPARTHARTPFSPGLPDCEADDIIGFYFLILFHFFAGIWLTMSFFVTYGTKKWVRSFWINLILCRSTMAGQSGPTSFST